MLLMAVLNSLLPVTPTMILHGIAQLAANSSRTYVHKKNIQWPIIKTYLLGSFFVFLGFRFFSFVPNKALIYVLLGSFPFFSFLPLAATSLSITKKGRPFLCGSLVTAAQILAGASGAILDIFYVNSPLDRYQIVASKAITQSIGHSIKLVYFSSLLSLPTDLTFVRWPIYPAVVFLAFSGSFLGKRFLDKISDSHFRKFSRILIFLVALTLIYKGLQLFFKG